MQLPENPFEISELYQKVIEDIANDRLKLKGKTELMSMRAVIIAYDNLNKSFSTSAPYLLMVSDEIFKRDSAVANCVLLWAAVISAIFAIIAAWPVVKGWLQTCQHDD